MGTDGVGEAVHAWHVDEREYRRHEQRRGRRHAFERLDPRRTALVVVDLVPFFARENPYCRGIVPHVNRLAVATRRTGGVVGVGAARRPRPVAGVRGSCSGPRWRRPTGPPEGAARCATGSGPRLTARADDLYEEKTAASAFFPGRCRLDGVLGERGVDTVVVTGTVTNVCVESTVRDASTLGYRVVLVADACAAVSDRAHNGHDCSGVSAPSATSARRPRSEALLGGRGAPPTWHDRSR